MDNDQELIQSDPTSRPLKEKENVFPHVDNSSLKARTVYRINSSFQGRWSFNYLKLKRQLHLFRPLLYVILQNKTEQTIKWVDLQVAILLEDRRKADRRTRSIPSVAFLAGR